MDLRYRLAVVTEAGAGLGREIAVALSRVGAAVLSVDSDLSSAEATAAQVLEARVKAWALQVDLDEEDDVRMLAARARDLGGMDLLVTTGSAPELLTGLFLEGLSERRGRRDGSPAVVHVCGSTCDTRSLSDLGSSLGARVMAVVPGRAPALEVTRATLELLSRGTAGEVAHLDDGRPAGSRPRTTWWS